MEVFCNILNRKAARYAVKKYRSHRKVSNLISLNVNVLAAATFCTLQYLAKRDGLRFFDRNDCKGAFSVIDVGCRQILSDVSTNIFAATRAQFNL